MRWSEILDMAGSNIPDTAGRKTTTTRRIQATAKRYAFHANATHAGKAFFKLIRKHFGKSHKFAKIFNKNNVKVRYSFMENSTKIANASNKKSITSH